MHQGKGFSFLLDAGLFHTPSDITMQPPGSETIFYICQMVELEFKPMYSDYKFSAIPLTLKHANLELSKFPLKKRHAEV